MRPLTSPATDMVVSETVSRPVSTSRPKADFFSSSERLERSISSACRISSPVTTTALATSAPAAAIRVACAARCSGTT